MRDGVPVALSRRDTFEKVGARSIGADPLWSCGGKIQGQQQSTWLGSLWVEAGVVAAIVDVRGATASFGSRERELSPDEQADIEIIGHLATQPRSSGKVITTGSSYAGNTADMATTRPASGLVGGVRREVDFDW